MYCRFPRGYFFEVEKKENLLEFEEIEDMRELVKEDEIVNDLDVFEFNSNNDEDERSKDTKKKEKHVEHKCAKHKDKKDSKCGCKKEFESKCSKEGEFFSVSDDEYVEEIKTEMHNCKCNCKNK